MTPGTGKEAQLARLGRLALIAKALSLRASASWARLCRKLVVLDADYFKFEVGDFHHHLHRNRAIRKRAVILRLGPVWCSRSHFGLEARKVVEGLSLPELYALEWDGISLLKAFRTRFTGIAGKFDIEDSPLLTREVVAAEMSQAIAIYEALKWLLPKLKPDSMLIFQGAYGVSRMLYELGQSLNTRTVALETSFMGDRVFLDGSTGMILNRIGLAQTWRFKYEAQDFASDAGERAFRMWEESKSKKFSHHATSGIETQEAFEAKFGFSLDRPFALLLAQVNIDGTVMLDSPLFPQSVPFLLKTIEECRQLEIPLVIRFHPRESIKHNDLFPVDPSFHEVLTALGGVVPENVCFVSGREVDTFMLVRHARVGITLASQSGLEMALHGKPVVIAAHSYYANKGFTWDVGHPSALGVTLEAAWKHADQCHFDAEIQRKAGRLLLDLFDTCMPLRTVKGSENVILRQFGRRNHA